MAKGTLLVSRAAENHAEYKRALEELGFKDVTVTAAEKDGLNLLINELQPSLVIVGSGFYKSATPYMMAMLKRQFKDLNIAAVSLGEYPLDLAVKFIVDGINSYVNYSESKLEFYKGLGCLREGKIYISPLVRERMAKRGELPPPSYEMTERQIEILRLLCNGFTSDEIADLLHLSKRTVEFHKAELFNNLGTRNENELIRVALYMGLIKLDELNFYGGSFALRPKQARKKRNRGIV